MDIMDMIFEYVLTLKNLIFIGLGILAGIFIGQMLRYNENNDCDNDF